MHENWADTEKALLLRVAEGDEYAFEQLFRRYMPQVRLAIIGVLKSETYVKDVLQEIFLDIWISREKLAEVQHPRNWIFKIAYNRCYTWLSRQMKAAAREKLVAAGMAEEEDGPDAWMGFRETASLIQEAVVQLSPRVREIYLLHRDAGLTVTEIAEKLGIATQTVRNALHRSSLDMKQFLQQNGVSVPLLVISLLFF